VLESLTFRPEGRNLVGELLGLFLGLT
jgi:hypothetical protein